MGVAGRRWKRIPRTGITIKGATAVIFLGNQRYAYIDTVDLPLVSHLSWMFWKKRSHRTQYAAARTGKGNSRVLMHRIITGAAPGELVDHADWNGLNNRRSNIRICTAQQNAFNKRKKLGVSSKFFGVSWRKREQKWCAQIARGEETISLGYFEREEDAARAHDMAAKHLHGEFATINFK